MKVEIRFHSDTNYDHWLHDFSRKIKAADIELSDSMQRLVVGTFDDDVIRSAENLGATVNWNVEENRRRNR